MKRRNHSSQQCSKRAQGCLCRRPYLIQPCEQPSCCLSAPSQGSASVSLAGRMRRKHQEEHQRKKKRKREIKDGKRKETEQRQKGDQRRNGAGKSTAKERDAPLVPLREKLFFRWFVDKTKPNRKQSKKIKIHKVEENTEGGEFRLTWRGENT